jgi:hypothetical protein
VHSLSVREKELPNKSSEYLDRDVEEVENRNQDDKQLPHQDAYVLGVEER